MNKSYDVYMCRKESSQLRADMRFHSWVSSMTDDERRERMWGAFANKIAREGFLKFDINGKLVGSS